MKLSQYAKKVGVTYRTAFRWWQNGDIKGYQLPSGTIVVTEGEEPQVKPDGQVAIYARVSSHEHHANLDRQAERLAEQRIDAMALASKNLWNLANYSVRQAFIFEHTYLNNAVVYHLVKSSDAYKALPRKVSNQVLIQLDQAWTAFFEEVEAHREHPGRFTGRPKLPNWQKSIPDSLRWPRDRGHRSSAQTACCLNEALVSSCHEFPILFRVRALCKFTFPVLAVKANKAVGDEPGMSGP
jgi:hypothetical protein